MVMRVSARCPCTVLPPNWPGPSKRTSLCASVLETYTVPLTGFTAMLKSVVPTPVKVAVGASVFASMAKTSLSGRLKRTAGLQFRARPSSHLPSATLNLTMSPVSGARSPMLSVPGGGRPPGMTKPCEVAHDAALAKPSQTAPSPIVVVPFPDLNAAA
jgi:hypothetical protein